MRDDVSKNPAATVSLPRTSRVALEVNGVTQQLDSPDIDTNRGTG